MNIFYFISDNMSDINIDIETFCPPKSTLILNLADLMTSVVTSAHFAPEICPPYPFIVLAHCNGQFVELETSLVMGGWVITSVTPRFAELSFRRTRIYRCGGSELTAGVKLKSPGFVKKGSRD